MPTHRILIVEDDTAQAQSLHRLLQKKIGERLLAEVEIVIVGTLADGLRESQSCSATILDLGLPDSDPVATMEALPLFRKPVIVMTGYPDLDLHAACVARGASHVFTKGEVMEEHLVMYVLDCIKADIRELDHAA